MDSARQRSYSAPRERKGVNGRSLAWLFLAASLWGAWFTWNVLWPMAGASRRGVVSFFAGWLTGELALHHLAWQVGMTLVFAGTGALRAWPGWVGLAITLLSWCGLARCLVVARRAEAVLEQALALGLGPRYAEEIPTRVSGPLASAIDWRRVLLPFPIRHPEVERVRDIVYARAAGRVLRLDVYRHRDHPTACPTLLQIHGGAWMLGSKNEQGLPLMHHLAARGWVCVAADYRLSPRATFPDHLMDLKRAVAWIREHGALYGADPDFLIVTGGSAGAHLAALVAHAKRPRVPARLRGRRHRGRRLRGLLRGLRLHGPPRPLARQRAPPAPRAAGAEGPLRERARGVREGVAALPPPSRCAALPRPARHARHARADRGGAPLLRRLPPRRPRPARLRGAPGRAARLRDLPVRAYDVRHPRRGALPRLGLRRLSPPAPRRARREPGGGITWRRRLNNAQEQGHAGGKRPRSTGRSAARMPTGERRQARSPGRRRTPCAACRSCRRARTAASCTKDGATSSAAPAAPSASVRSPPATSARAHRCRPRRAPSTPARCTRRSSAPSRGPAPSAAWRSSAPRRRPAPSSPT